MASTTILVPVEEYLRTSFPDGDQEYVDGRIVERNVGEIRHSNCQSAIDTYLRTHYKKIIWAGVEVRVQVRSTRFRVPDVTVVLGPMPAGRIIVSPPVLVVEVLSPDDRAAELQEKIEDYLSFGIPCVWVVNPETRRAYIYTAEGMREAAGGVLRISNPEIVVPLDELFA